MILQCFPLQNQCSLGGRITLHGPLKPPNKQSEVEHYPRQKYMYVSVKFNKEFYVMITYCKYFLRDENDSFEKSLFANSTFSQHQKEQVNKSMI